RLGHLRVRLRQGAVLLVQLREQAYVLDRNDRLIGKGLEQCDLLVAEGSDGSPGHRDGAHWPVIPEHRDGEDSSVDAERVGDLRVLAHVSDLDDRGREDRTRRDAEAARWLGKRLPSCIDLVGRPPVLSPEVDEVSVEWIETGQVSLTQARRSPGDGLEGRLDTCRGAGDYPQDLSGRCL